MKSRARSYIFRQQPSQYKKSHFVLRYRKIILVTNSHSSFELETQKTISPYMFSQRNYEDIFWPRHWYSSLFINTLLGIPLLFKCRASGPRFNIKTVFHMYEIPMLKIRRSRDRLVSYTRVSETSAGCLRLIYPSLGMRQIFGDVTMGQWRHN